MTTTRRLLHDGWMFHQTDAAPIPNSTADAWLPATVPGHVHLDLQRAGVIPNPFEGMHERSVQWVDDANWSYQLCFDVAADALAGARHVLRFEGLDTITTIVLNGAEIGATDNMFVAHEFDVTDRLCDGENTLRVDLASAEAVGQDRLDNADGLDDFRVDGALRGIPTRSFVRKAQYMWGWDWGPTSLTTTRAAPPGTWAAWQAA